MTGPRREALTDTGAMLDALEWLADHVGMVVVGAWHPYYRHHHLSWNRDEGRAAFQGEINTVFARNGVAFEMGEDGKIRRIVEGPASELLACKSFSTGDDEADKLLESARGHFYDRNPDSGRYAVEALWDAFERVKTLDNPADKKSSAKALIFKATNNVNIFDLIEEEMRTLTAVGNTWRIRHHEVGKAELGTDRNFMDYLFLRLFCLINFLLPQR